MPLFAGMCAHITKHNRFKNGVGFNRHSTYAHRGGPRLHTPFQRIAHPFLPPIHETFPHENSEKFHARTPVLSTRLN